MHVFVHHDGVGLHRQARNHRTDVVLAIVVHDVVGGNKRRHVATRLLGQIGINLPVVGLTARTVDGLGNVVGTTVVGGNHQIPVAVDAIKVLQIVGSSIRCLDGVATLVDQ